eukprot:7353731-Pyramimonas_sp.AAC.1
MIDEAVKRSKPGAIQIFYVGGYDRCWQFESVSFKMNPLWGDIAILVAGTYESAPRTVQDR